ncbi:MAG: DsbC family protein, partial [Colwellia sp.]
EAVEAVEAVEADLKGKLKNSQIDHLVETEIPGLYEVQTGQNIIYYHPEKKLFIFGEIYTVGGKSITAISKKMINNRILEKYIDKGITIGKVDAVNHIVEFTDPDCPYCRKYDNYITSQDESIKRTVFFSADLHPSARPKIVHLICTEDSEQREIDMNRIMTGEKFDFISCDKANGVIASHREIARKLRVTGTPTLFVNNVRVEGGANLTAISNLMIKRKEMKNES